MSQRKSILAICRHAPYGSALAREGLEAVLACAAMDQIPEVLLINDGVFLLLEQDAQQIHEKSLRRNLTALPMFGVETLHLCERSLQERGIDPAHVSIPGADLKLLQNPGAFIADFDQVLSF